MLVALLPLITLGCGGASVERAAALSVASRSLSCPADAIELAESRETTKVREYVAGCDLVLVNVLCSNAGCHPAKPRPPCTQGGCYEEDPVTLEWTTRSQPQSSR